MSRESNQNLWSLKEKETVDTTLLRDKLYPVPSDCPGESCPECRPACALGICKIAVELCEDF